MRYASTIATKQINNLFTNHFTNFYLVAYIHCHYHRNGDAPSTLHPEQEPYQILQMVTLRSQDHIFKQSTLRVDHTPMIDVVLEDVNFNTKKLKTYA